MANYIFRKEKITGILPNLKGIFSVLQKYNAVYNVQKFIFHTEGSHLINSDYIQMHIFFKIPTDVRLEVFLIK